MFSSAAGKSASVTRTQAEERRSDNLILRKIWLPRLIYQALPWFYVGSGVAAFLATLYISDWFWILPHYALFSVACVHLGLFVYRRRRRSPVEDA